MFRIARQSTRYVRSFSVARLMQAKPTESSSTFVGQDPYPLHNRTSPPRHPSEIQLADDGSIPMNENLEPLKPIDRSHENTETKRARLLWQSRKRGILETDLLLSTFAAKELSKMNMEELILYDRFLDEPDWEIYYYATEKKQPPMQFQNTDLIKKLVQHVKNEEKETRSMPSLKNQSANYRADQATDPMNFSQEEGSQSSPMTENKEAVREKQKAGEPEELKEKMSKDERDPAGYAS